MAKSKTGEEPIEEYTEKLKDNLSFSFSSGTSHSSGTEQQYTRQSLMDLYALGGDLTAYTDTLESLKDYNPEKYTVGYDDTTKKDWLGNEETVRQYKDPFYDTAEFASKKAGVMGAFEGRLASIQTQRDQPGRNQLLAGSGGILG